MKAHIALCLSLVGCVADPDSPDLGETVSFSKNPGNNCTDWECGSNSPVVELADKLWDLSEELDVPNSGGYSVEFFGTRNEHYGAPTTYVSYRPDVRDAKLYAYTASNQELANSDVVDMMWRVVEQSTGNSYELMLKGVGETHYWAQPAVGIHSRPVQTYWLEIRRFVADWSTLPTAEERKYGPKPSRVCGTDPDSDGSTNFQAVLFDGDWLDADAIRVRGERAKWFNIGCAGSALWKQHLTAMTLSSAKQLGYGPPSVNLRTASLKMITSDICGLGHSFTYQGQPLRWKTPVFSNVKTLPLLGQVQTLEARWNQNGALCLNTPRVDFRSGDGGDGFFPGGVEAMLITHTDAYLATHPDVTNWCTAEHPRPPPCVGTHNDTQRGTLVTSVNYGAWFVPL